MTSSKSRLQQRKQPRQARAELTRQRILTAAAQVFGEYGYAAGTTNRIAERARVSIGSLYQYFPNKDAILVELLVRHLDSDKVTDMLRLLREQREPIDTVIRVLVRTAIENHRDDPQLLRIMIEEAPRTDELMERVIRQEQEMIVDLRDLFERHPEVRVRNVDMAARLVASTLDRTVHQLIAAGDCADSVDTGQLESELVTMITGYLRVDR